MIRHGQKGDGKIKAIIMLHSQAKMETQTNFPISHKKKSR
jgi:hypothetical protein